MAYYDTLVTAWNGATQPPTGVTGTAITGGMTTAQKLAAVNGWTVTGVIPSTMTATGPQVLNCVVWSEFNALTPTQQSNFLMLCSNTGSLIGGSANLTHILPGMIIAYFGGASATVAALSAFSKTATQPWWQSNNYPRAFDLGDVATAGLS